MKYPALPSINQLLKKTFKLSEIKFHFYHELAIIGNSKKHQAIDFYVKT